MLLDELLPFDDAKIAYQKLKIHVDDPVGAISVHGVCGAFGTILLGLFHTEKGIFYALDKVAALKFLGVQILGVVSVFAWCVVTGLILFSILKATLMLRVSEEEEIEGLDFGEHGASAYPDFQVTAMR